MNKSQELFKTMQENPELELIVFVGQDAYSDWGYMLTDISKIDVVEVATQEQPNHDGFRVYTKSEISDMIEDIAEYELDGTDEAYEKAKILAEAKPWKKVIRVYVDQYNGDVI